MIRDALISPGQVYRYTLSRTWDDALPYVCFIMLNPSTADGETDDPTIRRCVGFAKDWGFGAVWVVNVFAWRATSPYALISAAERGHDVVGPDNDMWVRAIAKRAGQVVCAWGNNADKVRAGQAALTYRMLIEGSIEPVCLKLLASGHPGHPLYLARSTERRRFYGLAL